MSTPQDLSIATPAINITVHVELEMMDYLIICLFFIIYFIVFTFAFILEFHKYILIYTVKPKNMQIFLIYFY